MLFVLALKQVGIDMSDVWLIKFFKLIQIAEWNKGFSVDITVCLFYMNDILRFG